MKKEASAWWRQAARLVEEAAGDEQTLYLLVEQLASRDPHISVPAIWALQQAGPVAIPVLLAGLQHSHTKVRRNCVDVIDHGGYGGDARCIEALLSLLHDPVPHIRRAVWHTLFCERCVNEAQCEVKPQRALDRVALLIEVGLHDANLKLRRQLTSELLQHAADPRVRPALVALAQRETDPELLALCRSTTTIGGCA